MSNETQEQEVTTVVPGTDMSVEDFTQEFCDRMTTDEDGQPSAAEADLWAKDLLGGEPSDEVKAVVTPSILVELQKRDQNEQPEKNEAPVSASEDDSDTTQGDRAEEGENASEDDTEAPKA